jgi:hypothetical protein
VTLRIWHETELKVKSRKKEPESNSAISEGVVAEDSLLLILICEKTVCRPKRVQVGLLVTFYSKDHALGAIQGVRESFSDVIWHTEALKSGCSLTVAVL